jgi:hypothetical protein
LLVVVNADDGDGDDGDDGAGAARRRATHAVLRWVEEEASRRCGMWVLLAATALDDGEEMVFVEYVDLLDLEDLEGM